MHKITHFPASDTMTVDQAIAEATKRDWSDVLVCGYIDDRFAALSSRMSRQDALWLSRLLADWAVTGDTT